MTSVLRPALSLMVLMTLITGVAYPLVVTGVAQVAFPDQANGSLVRDAEGKVRGSALIAQDFVGDAWFHPRPSAGAFATVSSSASNLAPSNPALATRVIDDAHKLQVPGQGQCLWPCSPPRAAALIRTCHPRQLTINWRGSRRRAICRRTSCGPWWRHIPSGPWWGRRWSTC